MVKTKRFLINLCMFIIFMFVIPNNVAAASEMPHGSKIATISVEHKTEEEIKELLEQEINRWQEGEDIILTSDFQQITIPRTAVIFDVDVSINMLKDRTKRTFTSLFMKQKNVHVPLSVKIDDKSESIQSVKELDYIQSEEMFQQIKEIASELEEGEAKITYIEGKEIPLETIAEVEMNIPTISNAVLTYAIDEINEYMIASEDHFSFVQAVVLPEHLTNSSAELSFLATALYTLFLQTNFDIVERHAGLTVPSYTEPGLDVAIDTKGNKDLLVMNPNKVSFKIEAEKRGDKLHVAIRSSPSDITYTYDLENVREIKQRTLYRYSKKLKAGEQETIQPGRKGLKADVYRSTYEQNVFIHSEFISQDVYLPEPKVVLVSTTEDVPDDALVENLEDEIEEEINNLEKEIDDLEEGLKDERSVLDIFSIDSSTPTFSEQLQKIRQTQATLEERLSKMEKELETYIGMTDEEVTKRQKEAEERFEKMNEQLEHLLEHLYSEGTSEQEEGGRVNE
ncbi:G5 domain-containing protein [Pseudogracilibacillus auburnensis]|uniref:VanW like protein n=1 Tax=Pseudogracilibacillus auburnensis TaxID=1494959 RepID=A0A2V3VTT7_9BACI|nr:G5 domain-containing protein [Pseudogracilibacillus auburnensis]PXW85322.1 VanW like protein [Pseudogracilibacillus auburnensis]